MYMCKTSATQIYSRYQVHNHFLGEGKKQKASKNSLRFHFHFHFYAAFNLLLLRESSINQTNAGQQKKQDWGCTSLVLDLSRYLIAG